MVGFETKIVALEEEVKKLREEVYKDDSKVQLLKY